MEAFTPSLASLYICYLALSEPLVYRQVIPHLEGLAQGGHTIHLLTFERARSDQNDLVRQRAALASRGIYWHALRYHRTPKLVTTAYDVFRGIVRSFIIIRRFEVDVVHARIHIPDAMALVLNRLSKTSLIFDNPGFTHQGK